MGNEMKTSERILNALQRVKELLTLASDWSKKRKEDDLLNKEFKKAKQKIIDDLYIKLGSLSDRYMFNHKSEFVTKEYLVEYEALKKQIKELEK
jgi:flagellin-like hook-associated protein FlgL